MGSSKPNALLDIQEGDFIVVIRKSPDPDSPTGGTLNARATYILNSLELVHVPFAPIKGKQISPGDLLNVLEGIRRQFEDMVKPIPEA